MTRLLSLFSGVWGYVVVAAFAAALAFGATHWIDANAYGKTIADLKTTAAKQQAADATAALSQLSGFIADLQKAAHAYKDAVDDITAKYAAISTEFKHAIAKNPLPDSCRIDSERLRILSAAVAQANRAHPATGH